MTCSKLSRSSKDVSVSKVPLETLQRWAPRVIEHAQRMSDWIQDEPWIAHGRKIYEHCAVIKLRSNAGGQLDCEPCLAHPRRTRDCDEPHVAAQNEVLRRP